MSFSFVPGTPVEAMADGIVNHDFSGSVEAVSAGTEPHGLNARAVKVMEEIGIDISANSSDHLSRYEQDSFDYVISLCGDADEKCPAFFGGTKRLHMPFMIRHGRREVMKRSWLFIVGCAMKFAGSSMTFSRRN